MGSVRAVLLLCAVVVVGALVGTQLSSIRELPGAALADPSPPVPSSPEAGAPGPDAAWYAQAHNVSLAEAARRLGQQPDIGQLNATLEVVEASTFAGLWIEHAPRYRVVARFTRDWDRTLARHISGTSLDPIVEGRPADHTLVELWEHIDLVSAALSGLSFSASVNVRENRVDVEVDSREELDSYLRAHGLQLPPSAHVVVMGPSRSLDCGDEAGEPHGIFFPRHCTKPWEAVPQALMEAPVILRDGCLWLAPSGSPEIHLATWPPGWVPLPIAGAIELRDADGVKQGAVGDMIRVGGGELADHRHIADRIGREPPTACRGHRAWFVSGAFG